MDWVWEIKEKSKLVQRHLHFDSAVICCYSSIIEKDLQSQGRERKKN